MSVTPILTVRPVALIETLRREKGWRQADLARHSDLHPSVVSRVEAGQVPGPSVRARLARALDVPVAALWSTVHNDVAPTTNGRDRKTSIDSAQAPE
jgi:transcriptional regulator with XRE-family HTH domain